MRRTSAPPSADESNVSSSAVIAWYRGGVRFSAAGRLTQSCTPWVRPPERTNASVGTSSCRIPEPAVIHWVSPSPITPPPPLES